MSRASFLAFALAALAPLTCAAAAAKPNPVATARSWAIRIVVPGAAGKSTKLVRSAAADGTYTSASFAYPADGSVIITGATTASASAKVGARTRAVAASGVTDISIFDGEITADSLTARADAATGRLSASGTFGGTRVSNLQALGRRHAPDRMKLGNWGYLTTGGHGVDSSAPEGTKGYHGFVTALDVHLSAAHGGLPAGSEILVGYAEAEVQTAPPPTPPGQGARLVGDRPQDLPKTEQPLIGVPQLITPPLDGGPYVFPVFGRSSYAAAYGTFRTDVVYHHGDDILGELGQPVVAMADGTVFSVGWNRDGGNRLWLRDRQGNTFYYAHLAAFSTLVANGARVHAGQVIGFMGDTGDTEGLPAHLHFEVHPVSLLFLGYDGAVDPTTYLRSWRHLVTLPFPVATGWAPSVPGQAKAPEPGAFLLGVSDISTADGLDPPSLLRAIKRHPAKPAANRP
jgi:hypothetical protein